MIIDRPFARAAFVALLLAAGGCATDRFAADVTRFHLGGAIARGTVFVEPESGPGDGLAFRQYAAAVGERLRQAGFAPVATRAEAEFVAMLGVAQATRSALPGDSPVRVGVGAGGGGGGFGLGGGISIPIGKRKSSDVQLNTLTLTLRRKSDQTRVWEGRATAEARGGTAYAGLPDAVPMLADALLRDFPGPSGATTRYTPPR